MKIDKTYRHVYLYAKGWYMKSKNPLKDMQQIISDTSGVDAEYISSEHIARVLTRLVMDYFSKDRFENILMGAIGVTDHWDEREGIERYILRMVSALFEVKADSLQPLKEILGNPDPKILPLTKHNKN